MGKVIQVQWSAPNLDEARKICKELVAMHLVACANIIPEAQSIYIWEGNLETSSEAKVYLKTVESKFEEIVSYILEHGSYKLPEITKGALEGYVPYLTWVFNSVS